MIKEYASELEGWSMYWDTSLGDHNKNSQTLQFIHHYVLTKSITSTAYSFLNIAGVIIRLLGGNTSSNTATAWTYAELYNLLKNNTLWKSSFVLSTATPEERTRLLRIIFKWMQDVEEQYDFWLFNPNWWYNSKLSPVYWVIRYANWLDSLLTTPKIDITEYSDLSVVQTIQTWLNFVKEYKEEQNV